MTSYLCNTGILIGLFFTLHAEAASHEPAESLPSNSIYHLSIALEDQDGVSAGLDQFRGNAVLVTMFYANCPHVCPLLISTIKLTEAALTNSQRSRLRILAISVDPERDTPEFLQTTMRRHDVDSSRWSMVRPNPTDLRAIAGVLGTKYKQLPNGEFSHNTRIVLVNELGSPIADSSQLGRIDEAFLAAIKKSLP